MHFACVGACYAVQCQHAKYGMWVYRTRRQQRLLYVQGNRAMHAPASSPLLLGAFHLEGWLNWLRTGMRYPAAATTLPVSSPPLAAAASADGAPADRDASSKPPAELDVHRMNQAQAKVAVLQQLAALAADLPSAQVQAVKNEMLAGVSPLCNHAVAAPVWPRDGWSTQTSACCNGTPSGEHAERYRVGSLTYACSVTGVGGLCFWPSICQAAFTSLQGR